MLLLHRRSRSVLLCVSLPTQCIPADTVHSERACLRALMMAVVVVVEKEQAAGGGGGTSQAAF
jgi:hypothetical protein